MTRKVVANENDLDRDPITGTPGAHPLGTDVKGRPYEYYGPGFRAGWEGRVRHDGRSFEEAEAELKADYNRAKGEQDPTWQEVRPAARAAWERVDRAWKAS